MSQPTEPVVNDQTGTTEPTVTEPTTSSLSHEDALKELSKVRAEAASRRIELKDFKQKADEWDKYQESQKTELQKLQDSVADRDKQLAAKDLEIQRTKIAKQHNVADEDLDLLVGDEANMKRLAERLGSKTTQENNSPRPVDLLAGSRGTPPGKGGNETPGNFMDNLIRGKQTN